MAASQKQPPQSAPVTMSSLSSGAKPPASGQTPATPLDLTSPSTAAPLTGEVPRETLVALVKKKDKDVKTLEAKLEKIEDRYVKLVRFNKILHEDRASFLKFCRLLLQDPETAFEEAAAQETPINLDLLTHGVESLELKDRELSVLRDFVRLVFPNDAESVLKSSDLDSTLRSKWLQLEELQSRSIQEANVVAQQNVHTQNQSVKQMESENRSLKAENRELQLQLESYKAQQNARAQALTSKMNKAAGAPAAETADPPTEPSGAGSAISSAAAARTKELEQRIQALQKENLALAAKCDHIDGTYRAELELGQRMLQSVKAQQAEEKQTFLDQLFEKEKAVHRLEEERAKIEDELDTSRMITKAAEIQANRDLILREQGEETRKLRLQVRELEQRNRGFTGLERNLKERIRELEIMADANVDKAYLREVVYKYCEYAQRGDMKAQTLIPAVCTVIGCSTAERNELVKAAPPRTWQVVNQAVGQQFSNVGGGEQEGGSSGSQGGVRAVVSAGGVGKPGTPGGAGRKGSQQGLGAGVPGGAGKAKPGGGPPRVPPSPGATSSANSGFSPPGRPPRDTSGKDAASTTASQASEDVGAGRVASKDSKPLIKTSERRPELRKAGAEPGGFGASGDKGKAKPLVKT